jgi:TM2 domain-containing membrane protein YozV
LIISFNNVRASGVESADSLFAAGNYFEAGILYEKYIYDNFNNDTLVASTLLKKVNCYKSQQRYDLIYPLLTRTNKLQLTDSLIAIIQFEKALGCYLDHKFELAKESILPVLNMNTGIELDRAAVFLYCLTLNELGKWEESKLSLLSYINRVPTISAELKDSLISEINMDYNKDRIPKLKNLKKARLYSFIFPGAGQVYTGNAGRGLITFSLIAGAFVFSYVNLIHELYFASAAGAYLVYTFYIGNINQLHSQVSNTNSYKKSEANTTLKRKLSLINYTLSKQ